MPLLKKSTIFFDLTHNEMLNIEDEDYSEFSNLIQRLGFKIVKNDDKELTKKTLQDVNVLVIGNPISSYLSNVEIRLIVGFVREGGSILILSEYGADFLQKTNLNDLTGTFFGIFFEKNIIKEENKVNHNCTSILSIEKFENFKVTSQLREIRIGGSCSLLLNKLANPLLTTDGNNIWTEEYDSSKEQWIKEDHPLIDKKRIIGAYRGYGRGKIVALGDIDIFTNDPNIGINKLDNRKFITNLFTWLTEPIKEASIRHWALDQLGTFQDEIKEINKKISNLIETMTFLERRISTLEEKNKLNEESSGLSEHELER